MTTVLRSTFGKKPKPVSSRAPFFVQGTPHLPGIEKISQRQDYTPEEALAEFIDNSYSARVGGNVHVKISIFKSENDRFTLRIDDDAAGIAVDSLAQVLSYGLSFGKGNNNEHGAGMKQASSSGNTYLKCIESKTDGTGKAFQVEFKNASALFRPVEVKPSIRPLRGTMFELDLPFNHAFLNEEGYNRIVERLQVMYQKTLGQTLFITMHNTVVENSKTKSLIPDSASKYIYNPAYNNTSWLVKGHTLQGNGWSAKINVGYLPETKEPLFIRKGATLELSETSTYSAEQKGIYVFKKERLLGQLTAWKIHASLPKAFAGSSENFKHLVLEVEVDDGIASVPTKNALANPPLEDNTLDTPLTELQNALYKYLNRLSLDIQPTQTLVLPHLLSAKGIHTLMQTIEPDINQKKVGPASLDLTGLSASWRAGWKTIAPFGNWKIWTHPLHEICLVMHKNSATTELDFADVPNYALLQMHIEKTLTTFPKSIFIGHAHSDLLKQEHVPLNTAVHIGVLSDLNNMLRIIEKNERIENSQALPTLSDSNLTLPQKVVIFEKLVQLKLASLSEACSWLNLDLVDISKKDKSLKNTMSPQMLEELNAAQELQQIRRLIQKWTASNDLREKQLGVYNTDTSEFFLTLKDATLYLEKKGITLSVDAMQKELGSGRSIGNNYWRRETLPEMEIRENVASGTKYSAVYVKPRPVCLEHGRIFDSISDAVDWLISEGVPAKQTTLRATLNLDHPKSCYGLNWENFKPGKIYEPKNAQAKPKLFEKSKIVCLENGRIFNDAATAAEWLNTECETEIHLTSVYHAVNKSQKLAGLRWARYDPAVTYIPSNIEIKPFLRKIQKIVCLEYGEVFENGSAAVAWINKKADLHIAAPAAIFTAIKNNSRAYGLTWSYAEPDRVYTPLEVKPTIKSPGDSHPSAKAPYGIVCLETGIVYKTVQDACRWLRENGIQSPVIDKAIYGKNPSSKAYGLTWTIVDPLKKYIPLDESALPRKITPRSIVCLDTGHLFGSASHACEWVKKHGLDLSETHLTAAAKENRVCMGLNWSYSEAGKIYTPINPDAVPFHAKKMLFCNKTQETFKNLNIFTKWLKEKSGLDISVNDTIKVVAGIDKEIHGYDICYAP